MLLLSKVPGPKAALFQKGYVPPREKTELRMQQVPHFNNADGFWTGLEKVSNRFIVFQTSNYVNSKASVHTQVKRLLLVLRLILT